MLQDLRNIEENSFLTRALTRAESCLVSSGAARKFPSMVSTRKLEQKL